MEGDKRKMTREVSFYCYKKWTRLELLNHVRENKIAKQYGNNGSDGSGGDGGGGDDE